MRQSPSPVGGRRRSPLGMGASSPPETIASQQEKLAQLQKEVHGVTMEECQAALATRAWNVEEAAR